MKRVAVLDFYQQEPNQGMRCIIETLEREGFASDVYEVRCQHQIPKVTDYDAFVSSGGPGDPHEVLTHDWGPPYQAFLNELKDRNAVEETKRHAFLICHSYQMACITWGLAEVTRRKSRAFGIYPMNKTSSGASDPLLDELGDPFWVVDSREWQVIQPHPEEMAELGAEILAIERERPHVPLERAAMMIRFTPEIVGTQFHPEADESSMEFYLNNPERLQKMLDAVGEEKVEKIRSHLGDKQGINHTHHSLIPTFLSMAR